MLLIMACNQSVVSGRVGGGSLLGFSISSRVRLVKPRSGSRTSAHRTCLDLDVQVISTVREQTQDVRAAPASLVRRRG